MTIEKTSDLILGSVTIDHEYFLEVESLERSAVEKSSLGVPKRVTLATHSARIFEQRVSVMMTRQHRILIYVDSVLALLSADRFLCESRIRQDGKVLSYQALNGPPAVRLDARNFHAWYKRHLCFMVNFYRVALCVLWKINEVSNQNVMTIVCSIFSNGVVLCNPCWVSTKAYVPSSHQKLFHLDL